jgi:hypothetical protein
MASVTAIFEETTSRRVDAPGGLGAISWPAVLAGAVAAAALSLILLVLGTGLGLSVVSPWSTRDTSVEAIGWATILWIAFMALASSGLGGYIAGRLRVRWPSVHLDEVYFRDTAHGFLAWAVATLLTAALLTSAIGTILGAGAKVGAGVAAAGAQAVGQVAQSTAAQAGGAQDAALYDIDPLFRNPAGPPAAAADASFATTREEIARIFRNEMQGDALPVNDTRYIAQVVAQRTGLSEQEAEARVTATFDAARNRFQQAEARARAVADQARKAGAKTALWIFVSLLLGAFFASLMATYGGRRRDMY